MRYFSEGKSRKPQLEAPPLERKLVAILAADVGEFSALARIRIDELTPDSHTA
jgi:hypothetical protein